jgi:uncharacterized membrane protein
MIKKLLFLAIFLLILPITQAAIIHGNIYDIELNTAKDTILRINTIPEQTFVAKEGSYSFTVSEGKYTITAIYESNYKKYSIYQQVQVVDEGDYILDLILFPDISEEQDILDQDINLEDPYQEEISYLWYVGFILIIIIITILFKLQKPKPKEEDDITKKVLKFIKDNGGRTTQKDIRKKFPMSEAKISLVITELEHKNKIKKIKKGRGNIIILN